MGQGENGTLRVRPSDPKMTEVFFLRIDVPSLMMHHAGQCVCLSVSQQASSPVYLASSPTPLQCNVASDQHSWATTDVFTPRVTSSVSHSATVSELRKIELNFEFENKPNLKPLMS